MDNDIRITSSSTYEISVNIKEKGDIISFSFKNGDRIMILKEKN